MDEPTRWVEADSGAPPDASALLAALSPPPPLPEEVRRASQARVARLAARGGRPVPRAVWSGGLGLGVGVAAAAVVFGMCAGPARPREAREVAMGAELRPLPPEERPPAQERSAGSLPAEPTAPDPDVLRPDAPAPPPGSRDRVARTGMAGTGPGRSVAPARLRKGRLTVTSVPWAEVRVDGEVVGTTPLARLRLDPGIHQLELAAAGYDIERRRVSIEAGGETRLAVRFAPEAPAAATGAGDGTLMINSVPWARVLVDGRDTGRNTPVVGLRLPAGRHRVGLRTADGTVHSFEVQIRVGETTRVVRRLE